MIKQERGIALVSLLIVIAIMTVIASTVVSISLDRFEINNLRKMYNDIEFLSDKVANYYLKYNGLPLLRDTGNVPIQYTKELEFQTNILDNSVYYILDLEVLEGISLNYGEKGFDDAKNNNLDNISSDLYIINESSHIIYYVQGINLKDKTYHTTENGGTNVSDIIPPSTPKIKVVSGSKNSVGKYITAVELEFIPGREDGDVAEETKYSIDNGGTWTDINELENNIYKISTTGNHQVKLRSYDKNGNETEEVGLELDVEIRRRKTLEKYSEDANFLELAQSYEGKLRNFKIYGNSVQNGIPTPEIPIEVECVGDKTRNLVPETYGVEYELYLTKGTTITVSADYAEGNVGFIVRYSDEALEGWWLTSLDSTLNRVYQTVTLQKDIKGFYYWYTESSNYQLEIGNKLTKYEPYGKYKIPVRVSSINLVDYTKAIPRNASQKVNIDTENNAVIWSGDYYFEIPVSIKSGETICCNYESEYARVWTIVYEDGNYSANIDVGKSITVPKDVVAIRIYKSDPTVSAENMVFKNIILSYGTEPKPYVPYEEIQTFNIYLDEPLRKIQDIHYNKEYFDYIDFENKKVIRNIGVSILDGTQHVYTNDTIVDGYQTYHILNTTLNTSGNRPVYSTKLIGLEIWDFALGYDREQLASATSVLTLRIAESRGVEFSTKGIQTWLSSNPIDIVHVLAESTEEVIELPEFKSFDEYTRIEVLTDIAPSKIEATYDGYEIQ